MSTIEEIAQKAESAYNGLAYPQKPVKPIKQKGESNAEFGKRLDAYEGYDLPKWRILIEEYRLAVNRVNETFKTDLLAALGLNNHPKANKVYGMAWDRGHSSGYAQVAYESQELSELLEA